MSGVVEGGSSVVVGGGRYGIGVPFLANPTVTIDKVTSISVRITVKSFMIVFLMAMVYSKIN